jgi:hypothetical protein
MMMRKTPRQGGLEEIAGYTGIEVHELAEMLGRPRRIPGSADGLGQFARRCFFRDNYTVFCPACVRERGLFRSIWNFRAVAACEVHALWLLDRCPQCAALVSWKRNSATRCACGSELGEAKTQEAPTDAVLLTKLMVSVLLDTSASELPALSPFCPDLRKVSAIEWLALFSFLATTSRPSRKFHPASNEELQVERDAVVIAARVFTRWPTCLFEEISTCWRRFDIRPRGSPFIPLRALRARDPIRHADRLVGPLSLPVFVRDAIDQYLIEMTVNSEGCGTAINPDWLLFDGYEPSPCRILDCDGSSIRMPTAAKKASQVSMEKIAYDTKQTDVVLHDPTLVEQLIGATRNQRRALQTCGFLQPIHAGRLIPSSEVADLKDWLRSSSTKTPFWKQLVPLSAFSKRGEITLQRVILAIQSRAITLFRSSNDDMTLDTCFVWRNFLE